MVYLKVSCKIAFLFFQFQNWIVGKYGRVMPIVYIRRPDKKKIMKVDPSRYVHHLKVMKETESKMEAPDKAVSELTWNVPERMSSNYKKRKGEFPQRSKQLLTRTNKVLKKTYSSEEDFEHDGFSKRSHTVIDKEEGTMKKDEDRKSSNYSNGGKFDDFEVVGVESIGTKAVSYSSYLLNLNRRNQLQSSHGNTPGGNVNNSSLSKYDSDNDSCGSADTDEICSGKKPAATEKRTQIVVNEVNKVESNKNIENGAMEDATQWSAQNQSRTQGKVGNSKEILCGNVKSSNIFDSDSASDSDGSNEKTQQDGELEEPKVQSMSSRSTRKSASKITGKDLASLMRETSEESSDKSLVESLAESSDDEDESEEATSKTGLIQTSQSTSVLKPAVAPKITGKDLASFMGETSSSSSSDESSNESYAKYSDNSDEGESEGEATLKTGLEQTSQPSTATKPVAPKITGKDLASFMGETSDDSSDESSTKHSDNSDGDDSESEDEVSIKKSNLGQNSQPNSVSKPAIAPKISGKDLASFIGETSEESSDDESSIESSAESSDGDSKSDKEDTWDDEVSSDVDASDNDNRSYSKTQVTETDVRQNCAVINAILSENSQSLLVSSKTEEVTGSSKTESNLRIKKKGKDENEKRSDLKSAASDASKSQTSSTAKKVLPKETIESSKKKALGNEARLDSLKRKRSEMSKQQALIHGALTSLVSWKKERLI